MKLLRDRHACDLNFGEPEEQLCDIYLKGKQTKQPVIMNDQRASKQLELIHSDLYGPIEETSLRGARYFALFVDDFSQKSIYFLKK